MRRITERVVWCAMFATVCAASPARQEVKRDFKKFANLAAGRSVRIDSSLGRISIRTKPGREVFVQAVTHCSADTIDEAQRICDQIKIVFDDGASGVSVRTDYPQLSGRFHDLSYAVDYDITMPDTAPLDLRNRFGKVDVVELHAPV